MGPLSKWVLGQEPLWALGPGSAQLASIGPLQGPRLGPLSTRVLGLGPLWDLGSIEIRLHDLGPLQVLGLWDRCQSGS